MSTPATVLFDLDLTLCVSEQDSETLLDATFAQAGVDPFCTVDDLATAVADVGTCETELAFYESLFTAAADRTRVDDVPTRELAHAHADCVDHSAVRFREGAEAALEHARESADRVGLVTNGGEASQTTKLETLGIADAFDAVVFVDPATGIEPKPHPAPFERAMALLDADPAETVHVGDSLRADVGGANDFGIGSVWVPYDEASHAGDHEPTHHIQSMAEFASLF